MHIALGGCLKGPPVSYGLTADTGGHIAYVLGAAGTQAALPSVTSATILTRLFAGDGFDRAHANALEAVSEKLVIRRLATSSRAYLEKEALSAELPYFIEAALAHVALPGMRPDVIHAHFSDAAQVAEALRDRFGIPFFYTPHSLALQNATHGSAHESRVQIERRAIGQADGIIVSSRDEADRQVAAYGVTEAQSRVSHLPPGPPIEEPDDQVPAKRLIDGLDAFGKPIVLAIARPVRKKNLVALAEAFAGCPELAARANLVIVAGQPQCRLLGEEERTVVADLDAVLRRPHMAGRALRLGQHSHADVQKLYRLAAASCGVFVNCAVHEPFGLTLLEAAAAGLPVVSTRHGGAFEIVETVGHGVLVDPTDCNDIAAACLGLVTDRSLRRKLSDAALRLDAHFSWTVYARRSLDLYAGAIYRRTHGLEERSAVELAA